MLRCYIFIGGQHVEFFCPDRIEVIHFGHNVENTSLILRTLPRGQCGFVIWVANYAAHGLTKVATKDVIDRTWWEEIFNYIYM